MSELHTHPKRTILPACIAGWRFLRRPHGLPTATVLALYAAGLFVGVTAGAEIFHYRQGGHPVSAQASSFASPADLATPGLKTTPSAAGGGALVPAASGRPGLNITPDGGCPTTHSRANAKPAGRRTIPTRRETVAAEPLMAGAGGVEPLSPAGFAPPVRPAVTDHWPLTTGHSIRMRVTAYCPCRICCGPRACGVTASGRRAEGLIVAADRSIPFGTRVSVPGYGVATVADRGGAIVGDRLDVLFASHKEAKAWGVRYLDVCLLPWISPDDKHRFDLVHPLTPNFRAMLNDAVLAAVDAAEVVEATR